MEDEKIIDLFFARDERAINACAEKYKNYLFTIAANILNTEDADECVNDTYLRAWETIPPKRPIFLQGFLAKIARNCSLDKLKVTVPLNAEAVRRSFL